MITQISEVIFGRFDNWVVGTVLGNAMLGNYSMAYRLTLLGHQLTQSALQPVVLSTFSSIQTSTTLIQYTFDRLIYWLFRITVLLSLLVLLLGNEVVVFIYTDRWDVAGSIFQNMWIFFGIMPVHEAIRHVLMGVGGIDKVVSSRVIMVVFFVPALILAALSGNVLMVAWAVNIALLLSTGLMFFHMRQIVSINWFHLLGNPFLAALAGSGLLIVTAQQFASLPLYLALFLKSFVIIGSYCAILALRERRVIRSELQMIWAQLKNRPKHDDQ
jgi:O-antigen/teichoic acid export membrane protein